MTFLPAPLRWTLYGLGLLGAGYVVKAVLTTNEILEPAPHSGGSFILDTLTLPGTKEDFVKRIMNAAVIADPTLSQDARILLAAWGAHESGWGKTGQARNHFNYFNISSGAAWRGPTTDGTDTEYTPGSSGAKSIVQHWRAYNSDEQAVEDLLLFLNGASGGGYVNYKEALTHLRAGDVGFASVLGVNERGLGGTVYRIDTRPGTAGFYTMPRSDYQASVSKLFQQVQAIVYGLHAQGVEV